MRPDEIIRPRHLAHLHTDPRGYPILATIPRDETGPNFASISEPRKLALAAFGWCAVCGLPFAPGDLRWISDPHSDDDHCDAWSGEAPVHQVCLMYAAQVCPFLASPRGRLSEGIRHGQRRAAVTSLLGYRRVAGVAAWPSPIQEGVRTLHFALEGQVAQITYELPHELAEQYAALLADETVPELTTAEAGLVGLFNEMSDAGDTVAGAALAAGAAFLPDVFKIVGISMFAEPRVQTPRGIFPMYRAVAGLWLDPQDLADFTNDCEDAAYRFAGTYLLERQGTLPALLADLRAEGRRLNAVRAQRNPQPRRASRARRKGRR